MDECDISVLTGGALRRAFLKVVHQGAIGVDGGPLVVTDDDGSTKVFYEGPSPPSVDLVSPAEQAVAAMKLFQSRGARFEATDSNLAVFCTIDSVMAMGWDYFEAGMRAYLLSVLKRDAGA
ncbi:hypothetical protein H3H37_24635 [Duganella sp. LX20W]|uniref:Uncharacterized protein n=1 Tax=Rugamonas brunnea TaxID=2758569 RepID=A0A7W2IEN5_9BURK|nr:hypothetical protein [Rugamonas brunnea]MBA5640257.1 hypothetical protein [Rugamonas brunnea]